jgi:hypothetical protein
MLGLDIDTITQCGDILAQYDAFKKSLVNRISLEQVLQSCTFTKVGVKPVFTGERGTIYLYNTPEGEKFLIKPLSQMPEVEVSLSRDLHGKLQLDYTVPLKAQDTDDSGNPITHNEAGEAIIIPTLPQHISSLSNLLESAEIIITEGGRRGGIRNPLPEVIALNLAATSSPNTKQLELKFLIEMDAMMSQLKGAITGYQKAYAENDSDRIEAGKTAISSALRMIEPALRKNMESCSLTIAISKEEQLLHAARQGLITSKAELEAIDPEAKQKIIDYILNPERPLAERRDLLLEALKTGSGLNTFFSIQTGMLPPSTKGGSLAILHSALLETLRLDAEQTYAEALLNERCAQVIASYEAFNALVQSHKGHIDPTILSNETSHLEQFALKIVQLRSAYNDYRVAAPGNADAFSASKKRFELVLHVSEEGLQKSISALKENVARIKKPLNHLESQISEWEQITSPTLQGPVSRTITALHEEANTIGSSIRVPGIGNMLTRINALTQALDDVLTASRPLPVAAEGTSAPFVPSCSARAPDGSDAAATPPSSPDTRERGFSGSSTDLTADSGSDTGASRPSSPNLTAVSPVGDTLRALSGASDVAATPQ